MYMHTLLISNTPPPLPKICNKGVQGTQYNQVYICKYVATSYDLEGKAVPFLWHSDILAVS